MATFESANTSMSPQDIPATEIVSGENTLPQPDQAHGSWLKRGLVAGAIAGVVFGGVEVSMHSHEVEQKIAASDNKWAMAALPVTEGMAWGGAALLVGAMGRKKNFKSLSEAIKDAKGYMQRMEGDRVFQNGMRLNTLGAVGTTAAWIAGGLALPESTQPLAYGIGAASIAISAIPVKVSYEISKRRAQKKEDQ
jgi:hypothetical protein